MSGRAALRTRLLAGAAVWLALALALSGTLLVGLFRDHVLTEQTRRMVDHLDELAAALELLPDGNFALAREPSYPLFHRPYSGLYWTVLPRDGAPLRSRSLWDAELALPAAAAADGEVHAGSATGPDGRPLLAWERTIRVGADGRPLRVVVAADGAQLDAATAGFTRVLVLSLTILGAGLLAAVAAQVWLGLRPLAGLRRALSAVREGRAERVQGSYPAEIQPVVDDLNTVLADKAAVLERARTQAGNLAHALKTPLSVLANEAATLAAQGQPELGDRLGREVGRMRRQVDVHLARARASGAAPALGGSTPVLPAAEALARTLARLHAGRGVAIAVDGDRAAAFRGEVQDLQEMLGNLMDNACKWAAQRVVVTVARQAGRVVVQVDDDGPGLPADRAAEVMRRGVRLDELVEGDGLGLAIVGELAGLYGGTLELGRSPMDGLRATLSLPAA